MKRQIVTAALMLLVFTLLTGFLYPAVVTGLGQIFFARQANGSVIETGNKVVGSDLIGQQFSGPEYFWGRLSATPDFPYNAAASSGSNLGPSNPALRAAIEARLRALQDADPDNKNTVPIDLVTASGSGLDPHISPAAAEYQVGRVARVRGLSGDVVRSLVGKYTEGRQFVILGEPRVNVLELNLALDALR